MKTTYLFFLFISFILLTNIINAQTVTPEVDGSDYSLTFNDIVFKVDASKGAKVSSFSLGGTEFLVSSTGSSDFLWGSTLWPAPQSEMNWPPPMLLDDGDYEASVDNNIMSFKSKLDEDKPGNSLQFIKSFWGNMDDTTISIRYSLVNHSDNEIRKSLWELTRPPIEGITFWPTGPAGTWGDLASSTVEQNDHTWLDVSAENRRNLKFFADGSNGWFAHLDGNRNLFIKTFEDVKEADFADGEGELELWIADNYIELENLSAAKNLNQFDTLHYDLKWYLRKLPESITAEVGNINLLNYVNKVIGNDPIAINDNELALQFNVYPNPASSNINISGIDEILTIQISTLTGQIISSIPVNNTSTTIDVTNLIEGLYMVTIQTNRAVANYKVLIK